MHAIATLVMGGNSYIPAAIALAKSLSRSIISKDIEFVCLVTEDVTQRETLSKYYHHVYLVNKIHVDELPGLGGSSATHIYHWISDAPTKWNIFALDTYEKVLFLDADMIVTQDITELFLLDVPAAMFDHQAAREYALNPCWTGSKEKGNGFINWYKIALGIETKKSPLPPACTSGDISDVISMPTGIKIPRECMDNLRLHSNSQFALHGGIALIKPDKRLLEKYKRDLPSIVSSLCMKKRVYRESKDHMSKRISHEYTKTDKTISGIDEVTLALFLHDMGHTWTHIGMEYNVAAFHTYGIFRNRTKILHYVGCYKPWDTREIGLSEREYVASKSEQGIKPAYKLHHEVVEIWWHMYEDKRDVITTEKESN